MDATASSVPRLGWRVRHRPRAGFAHALGAAAGAFAVVAIVAFVVEVATDDATAPGVGFSAALAIAALAAGFFVAGPIRSACVTAIVFSVPLVWIFAFLGDGSGGRGDVRAIYLLTFACYLVLYLVSWTKGRAIFLAGALLFFASWLTFEVAGSSSNTIVPFQSEVSNGSSRTGSLGFNTSNSSFSNADDTTDSTATVALVIGLIFLGVGAALDRRKLEGAATPFVVVGAIETIAGAVVLGGNQSLLLGGLLAVAAGAVVGIVGAQGDRRRATTWIGALTVFGGLVAVLIDIRPNSAGGVGVIALGFAVGLGLIAWLLAPVLREPNDGDAQPAPLEPTPPGGHILPIPDEAAA
jgi:hypothetical protein